MGQTSEKCVIGRGKQATGTGWDTKKGNGKIHTDSSIQTNLH